MAHSAPDTSKGNLKATGIQFRARLLYLKRNFDEVIVLTSQNERTTSQSLCWILSWKEFSGTGWDSPDATDH